MPKYRKKPVVIEAIKWDGQELPLDKSPSWLVEAIIAPPNQVGKILVVGDELLIHTLEGTMTASLGDYVICGIKGEIYPCKPDIFDKSYELVEE